MTTSAEVGQEDNPQHSLEQCCVIIPSLNPQPLLINLLKALQDQGIKHILLVDDGSAEEFQGIFSEAAQLGVTVLRHAVNQGKGAALKTAFKAAQAAADSNAQEEKEKVSNANVALELSMAAKQYDQASKYAKILQASKTTDPKILANIANAYYFANDFTDAKALAQAQVDADKKAGRVPDHNALMVVMSADAGLKDEAGAESTLEELVLDYNQPEDWAQMIDIAFGTEGLRDVDAIWLGRLLFLTGAPVSQNTGNMIGSIAGHLTFFGDAVNAKSHGAVVDPDPGPRADADKKSIAEQIAAEDKQNGTYSGKLAEALYSYGMYPEAEAAATKAIAKGGNPDTSEAPMVLGQAQAAQGKYDDALASFGKVTGGGPATARINKLWIDYVTVKKKPPAPATAAK